MPFVERDSSGVIGVYARPQPGTAEEFLAENHPDVVAFLSQNSPEVPLNAEELYDILVLKGVVSDPDRPRPK